MECSSQNDIVNDLVDLMKSGSELDVNMDDVIKNDSVSGTKNETDILSSLITAIGESLSDLSVNTAVTDETVEQSLKAYADPSLNTKMSFSTASELGQVQTNDQVWTDYCNPNPLRVWKNEERITGFEIMCDDNKVSVVDSLECLSRLQYDPPLEQVYFDPRVYLGIPESEDFEPLESDSDSVSTAELGPTSEEFEDWVKMIEEKG